ENPATHGPALQQSVTGFAKGFNSGPANESGQTLTFKVVPVTQSVPTSPGNPTGTPGDDSFFTADGQPAVDANGNLTLKVAPDAHGTASFRVSLQDNGLTANSGVDTSPEQIIHINISKPQICHNTKFVAAAGV